RPRQRGRDSGPLSYGHRAADRVSDCWCPAPGRSVATAVGIGIGVRLVVDVAHVVVLMLENRSFDHLLGYVPHPDPAFDGLLGAGEFTNPRWAGGPPVAASPDAKLVLPAGPDHSHDAVMEQLAVSAAGVPTNQGFVPSQRGQGT